MCKLQTVYILRAIKRRVRTWLSTCVLTTEVVGWTHAKAHTVSGQSRQWAGLSTRSCSKSAYAEGSIHIALKMEARIETSMSKRKGVMGGLFDDDSEDEGAVLTLRDLDKASASTHKQQGWRCEKDTVAEVKGYCDMEIAGYEAGVWRTLASSASNKQEETKDVSARNVSAKKAMKSNGTGFNAPDALISRPFGAYCFPEDGTVRKQGVSTHSSSGKGREVQRQHDLLGVFADGGNQGVVLQDEYESGSEESYYLESEGEFEADTHRGDEHEATGVHLVNSLCKQYNTLSANEREQMGFVVFEDPGDGTLSKIVRRVSLLATGYNTDKLVGIYKLTCLVSGKGYVGKSKDIASRWAQHKSAAKHNKKDGCRHLKSAIMKHGWDSFRKEILCVLPESELNSEEVRLISLHKTMNPFGYNLTAGGDETPFLTDEVRKRADKGRSDFWTSRFEETLQGVDKVEADRLRRKRDARRRAKHRFRAKRAGKFVPPISFEDAERARLAAANGPAAMAKRKATYARKRAERRVLTGNFFANS